MLSFPNNVRLTGSSRVLIILVALFMGSLFGLALDISQAQAAEITVNSELDEKKGNDGICSLREAIIAANRDNPSGSGAGECLAGDGDDTIVLQAGSTYRLTKSNSGSEDASTTGDLDIDGSVTITVTGAGIAIIDGGGISDRVFNIIDGNVTIRRVTIRGGSASGDGGGINVESGAVLHLENSTLTQNSAGNSGGAIHNAGTVTLTNVTIGDNTATSGGAIASVAGTVDVLNTLFTGNGVSQCSGTLTTLGTTWNLANVGSDCTIASQEADLGLSPQTDAGGITIYALLSDSPAVDSGYDAGAPASDQRGVARPETGTDIGAFELTNGPPEAKDDGPVGTPEDTPVSIPVTANDTDVDGNLNPGSAVVTGGPSQGGISGNDGSGTFTYSPNLNYNGSDSFTYEVCDTDGLCDSATVSINVSAVNDQPEANDDGPVGTLEDTSVSIPVTANDTDVDGNLNPASATVTGGPSQGGISGNDGSGTFTYSPKLNYNGSDSFTYEVCDTDGLCDSATVSINVSAVNDQPEANDDGPVGTLEDTSVSIPVTANDTDVDGNLNPASATVTGGPSQGGISGNDGSGTFTYSPNLNYNGSDSFTYEVCDTDGLCDSATVSINVSAVNDQPEANDDGPVGTPEDTPVSIPVTANDTDVDGNLNLGSAVVTGGPSQGGVSGNDGSGTFTYSPNLNYNGSDSFTYEVCDTDGLCDSATVSIDVAPVNNRPVANDDAYDADEDAPLSIPAPGVLGNDTDVDDDGKSTGPHTEPAHGAIEIDGDGSFIYTPNRHYDGPDSFTYFAFDGKIESLQAAVVTLNVRADAYIEVTNTCDSGEGSLRAAIERANSQPGPDTIIFDIIDENCGTDTILLQSPLPEITDPVTIDGTLNDRGEVVRGPGAIILDGTSAGAGANGLTISAGNSTVNGLTIQNFTGSGVALVDNGSNTISNNVLANNGSGITLTNSNNNLIQSNNITGSAGSGIVITTSSGNAITNNMVTTSGGDGIIIVGDGTDANTIVESGGNTLTDNTITGNSGSGITILDSGNNLISNNDVYENVGESIDLGGDGRTENDPGDLDIGANFIQNYPVVYRAVPDPANALLIVEGWLDSQPGEYDVQFYLSPQCGSGSLTLLNSMPFTVTIPGTTSEAYWRAYVPVSQDYSDYALRATATDSSNNTSEYSDCVVVSYANDAWTDSLPLTLEEGGGLTAAQQNSGVKTATVSQYLDQLGRSRWYKFSITPNSKVKITLSDLPANYDLTVYKDIQAVADSIAESRTLDDLIRLNSEIATDGFNPDAFNTAAFSANSFSANSFSANSFSANSFSANSFSDDAFSANSFSDDAFGANSFSANSFSANSFSANSFSANSFSANSFSANSFSANSFSANSFSSAPMRSLLGVSAFEGTSSEEIRVNTWNNTGEFYVRVRGRGGAFDLDQPFQLDVEVEPGACDSYFSDGRYLSLDEQGRLSVSGDHKTIILVDRLRMDERYPADQYPGKVDALLAKLAELAARPEINGVVVNVNEDGKVALANQLGDEFYQCPYGKNVVAESIKEIVDDYRAGDGQTLEYVVIAGSDDVIPFFRYPDHSLLAPESNYVPPVDDGTASQSSLKLGFVLSQDAYGAPNGISIKTNDFPLPGLAVGRLVETPDEMMAVVDAYLSLSTSGDPVLRPATAFVSGYDFLDDAARAVQSELVAGLTNGAQIDTLIAPFGISPLDPASWSAEQLKSFVLANRYDLAFLAGHFSANSALAADYNSVMTTAELADSPVDMRNAIIFSAGCHSGYNIVDEHGIPNVTDELDWAQAFAQKGATLIAGTGYQYGDTDFIEYSERIYLEFARQLRAPGAVSVGKALVAAKQHYLITTPQIRGIHEKALLEATIFGLPMLSMELPGEPLDTSEDAAIDSDLNGYLSDPGLTLGLQFADIVVNPALITRTLVLTDPSSSALTVSATWMEGRDGIVINPVEPILPLEVENVTKSGTVLRGVGFRGGRYTDQLDIWPLNSVPATELSGSHTPFQSDVFFPLRPWSVNYFDALIGGGSTRLAITPAQHRTSYLGAQTSTRRFFEQMGFRLYYSSYTDQADDTAPALAAQPTILQVQADPVGDQVHFRIMVVGSPAAGIQEVWVTHTACTNPFGVELCDGNWQSLDLTQDPDDSRFWIGSLSLGTTDAKDIRYIVQAVNGVGLVSLSNNLGFFYIPGGNTNRLPMELLAEPFESVSGAFGTQASFTASVVSESAQCSIAGQPVLFGLGPISRLAFTDLEGKATAEITLLATAGTYNIVATYPGNSQCESSSTTYTSAYTITPRDTQLCVEDAAAANDDQCITGDIVSASVDEAAYLVAVLTGVGAPPLSLSEHAVRFVITGNGQTYQASVITDYAGRAVLNNLSLLPGTYSVEARFDATESLGSSVSAAVTLAVLGAPTEIDGENQPQMTDRLFLPAVHN